MKHNFRNILFLSLILFYTTKLFSLSVDSLHFSYKTINSKSINVSTIVKKNKGCVFLFYSPSCPICQSQTKTINELFKQYQPDSIAFILVFPGTYYSKRTIKHFLKDYDISIPAIIDKDFQFTKAVNATVTPEAIVFDKYGNKAYSGLIDNYFEDIGKRRSVITENYLHDAIDAILQNKELKIKRTEPVGCILNIYKY